MTYKITRYLLRQLYLHLFLGMCIVVFVLMVLQVLRLIEFLVIYNVGFLILLKLMGSMSVSFLPIVIPTAIVFATLAVMGKFVEKKEWLGLLTSGIGYRKILPPVLLYFAFPIGVLCLVSNLDIGPWGNRQFELTLESIYNTQTTTGVREKMFFNLAQDVVMFIGNVDPKTNSVKRIFLFDERNPDHPIAIAATEGALTRNLAKGEVGLHLTQGSILSNHANEKTFWSLSYQTLNIDFLIQQGMKKIMPSTYSLSKGALEQKITAMKASAHPHSLEYLEYAIDYHRRFSFSIISIIFVVLGFAITLSSQKRYFKIPPLMMSLIILIVFWTSYVLNNFLSVKLALPGWLGLWSIVLIFTTVSLHQLYRKRLMY